MELKPSVISANETDDLGSLRDWLVNDADVKNQAKISTLSATPEKNEMGAGLDAIGFVLQTGFNIASPAVAIASWRETGHIKSTIEFQNDQYTIVLSPSSEQAIESGVREIGDDG
jgi:hypothetical protein